MFREIQVQLMAHNDIALWIFECTTTCSNTILMFFDQLFLLSIVDIDMVWTMFFWYTILQANTPKLQDCSPKDPRVLIFIINTVKLDYSCNCPAKTILCCFVVIYNLLIQRLGQDGILVWNKKNVMSHEDN